MDNKEFVSVDPNKLHNQSKIEEDDNDSQDRRYKWKRLFLMSQNHEFFNASPQNPQISYKQHQRKKRKKKTKGEYVTPNI